VTGQHSVIRISLSPCSSNEYRY